MQVEAFHHVTLPVSDLERSKAFYREIFRLREIERPRSTARVRGSASAPATPV